MQHAPSGRHAAGGQHDPRHAVPVERLGFFDSVDIRCDPAQCPAGFGVKTMLAEMIAEDPARVGCHRAVEIHPDIGDSVRQLEPVNVIEDRLHAPDREGRHQDDPAAPRCPVDHLGKARLRIGGVVAPVPVGRLDNQIVGVPNPSGVDHRRAIGTAEIPGEHERRLGDPELDDGGAEYVARWAKPQRDPG